MIAQKPLHGVGIHVDWVKDLLSESFKSSKYPALLV